MSTDNKNTETEQCTIPSVRRIFIFDKDLIEKTMRDETEFKQEVEALTKCFEADVFTSGD